ncbi:MAG: cob(I)yrinic acid a,c-diamide adenosyltransferase [Marinifilaceae bacterium]|nr:cob(I)yrinic acid a,c-diamide adenosyltransferase [Marinifilaceae bacterium]
MKVYTKTGDKGMTSLIGGTRVAKNNIRLDAYGGVDELNSHIGMIRSYPIAEEAARQLIEIQNVLFVVGANLATDASVSDLKQKMPCTDEDVDFLEKAIDKMDEELPPLKYFVLPGGHPAVSACHIARTVCRRVERRVMDMNEVIPVDEVVLRYINRLSDYLFVLGRKLAHDLGVEEAKWVPRG